MVGWLYCMVDGRLIVLHGGWYWPSKHAWSDQEAFWLWPRMAITASVHPESGRVVYADPTSRIRFSSVFPKKAWIILCKTDLDPIRMAWSAFCQTHLVWKQAGVQESSGPDSSNTQQFPTFRLSSVLPQTSRIIYCTTPAQIRFSSGWLCQVLGKWIRSRSKPVCKNHPACVWPMLPSRLGPDANRIRHVYWG